jgi:hypothetical protein
MIKEPVLTKYYKVRAIYLSIERYVRVLIQLCRPRIPCIKQDEINWIGWDETRNDVGLNAWTCQRGKAGTNTNQTRHRGRGTVTAVVKGLPGRGGRNSGVWAFREE